MLATISIRESKANSPLLYYYPADSTKVSNKVVSTFSSPVHTPDRVVIVFGLLSGDWKIVQPLAVKIEYSDGLYIASDDLFGIYGDGNNENDALEDYRVSLLDYYELMIKSEITDKQNEGICKHLRLYIEKSSK
jgi:hypothetical protein